MASRTRRPGRQQTVAQRAAGNGAAPRTQMESLQRTRLLAGTVAAACEEGAANVTVSTIVARAGISRRTFYELFTSCEECVLAAIDDAVEQARERVLAAWQAEQGAWRARVRASLAALLSFFEERPQVAELLIVQWPAAGSVALARRQRVLAELAGVLERGRARNGRGPQPPKLAGEATVGATLGVLHARILQAKQAPRLLELTSPLISMIVMPYGGSAAARRELERAAPQAPEPRHSAPGPEAVLGDLRLRLTERTIAVISAVGVHPGASNRTIADAAGIADQGQVSKLLARLQKLGLIENRRSGASRKGQPNSWRLTARGRRVQDTLLP